MIKALQQNSFGYKITITTGLNLTGATGLRLRFKKPGSVIVDRLQSASEVTVAAPASGGIVEYIVRPDDFVRKGKYSLQVIDLTPGRGLYSTVEIFDVEASIDTPTP